MLDEPVLSAWASLRLEHGLPVRSFFSWPGKRNYEGSWWSSTTGSHVSFESLLERDFLMLADYDQDVLGIASQPFAVLWPKGTEGVRGHVPDFFLRLRDGSGRVVDVRHRDHLEAGSRQFAMTRALCEEAGWDYEVFSGISEPRFSNLRWLSGYRLPRYAPTGTVVPVILEAVGSGISVSGAVRRAARMLMLEPSIVQAHLLHLAFVGILDVGLDESLSMDAWIAPSQEMLPMSSLAAAS
ncbi:TnsA-like heteromeric transposase endonuclease subunit [Paenarthrobacter sp. YJN-5]|uniref:TnsA-like heteromeric transposase endonuclease subunit n=1 Tax=Paenarthrobacter sp. YJN-5 TaxID=2735316 RepID=UPI001878CF58|nr:TnsA-like heteromeric transposase endonuclease subunit [Paenarthrobacter sp. YJN-5]QOT15328.1 TnsA-like heteromeric transposase endonuclease subunit [Paenarthrobacter sp. YJN-5]